jgi:hypothetical protein
LKSGQPAVDRIAQAALHDLAVRELDVERRFQPRDAATQSEVMEGRGGHLLRAPDDLLGRSEVKAPFDGSTKGEAPADTLTDKEARERVQPANDPADK